MDNKWTISNGFISLSLRKDDNGMLLLEELEECGSGFNWGFSKPVGCLVYCDDPGCEGMEDIANWPLESVEVKEEADGGAIATAAFRYNKGGISSSLELRLPSGSPALFFGCSLTPEKEFTRIYEVRPAAFGVRAGTPLDIYCYGTDKNSSKLGLKQTDTANLPENPVFPGFTVLIDPIDKHSLMITGDYGGYMESNMNEALWSVKLDNDGHSVGMSVGFEWLTAKATQQGFVVPKGQSTRFCDVYLTFANGDRDDAVNVMRRVLRRHILLPLSSSAPDMAMNVWFTDEDAGRLYLEELDYAKWMGFDNITLDASWYEGSCHTPGTNDWSAGLGSYHEDMTKFPAGMRAFSDAVHAKGLKFGIWIDPQNVDSERVINGQIPDSYLAKIGGEALHCNCHPLSLTNQLCLGNPEVVDWLKGEILGMIERYNVDYIKWDPSATDCYSCDRDDHGHSPHNGAHSHIEGRKRIFKAVIEKYPEFEGWECIQDVKASRINPILHAVTLFPDYSNSFIIGPMVAPLVWGGTSYISQSLEVGWSLPSGQYFEAAFLDYFFRNFMVSGGFSIGNITGMISQRLSGAPLGYNEAFKRNVIYQKQVRHLFREDFYRFGLLDENEKWRAFQFVSTDKAEACVYVFRDGAQTGENKLRMRSLDPNANYKIHSFNERKGKELYRTGRQLMEEGLDIKLPHPELTGGFNPDKVMNAEDAEQFKKQLAYGSDLMLLTRI